MTRLELVSPCPHGEDGHCIRKNPDCPGGTRTPVTIDYEAARAVADLLASIPRTRPGLTLSQVQSIVAAALGQTTTKETHETP